MGLPKRGEKGFTLIELLIVVAILGVLAAVVIPNVGRFIGRGQTEAAQTELTTIQSAVSSMMVDNGITALDANDYATTATSNMSSFPDPGTAGNTTNELVLFGYGGDATVNYVQTEITTGTYTCDAQGTVTQVDDGY
ncbi:type II secretion system protein [Chloroflexota bacterium]